MKVAERFGKTNTCSHLNTATLKAMLALPEGEEDALAQVAAGKPVENQSKREVRTSVKQWKNDKKKKSSPPFDKINLFPDLKAEETASQSVDESKIDGYGEYESNPNSELNSPPTQESIDDTEDEPSQAQIHEDNPPLETSTFNSTKENFNDDLTAMRDEMQQLLAEISDRIQTATKKELANTIQVLKSVRALLNKKNPDR